MSKFHFHILAICIFLVTGCQSFPTDDIKTTTEADPKANIKGYKTYAWLGSAGILKDPEGKWEPPKFDADAEITKLINQELRKRGMTEVSTKPDVVVAYALGVDMAALKTKTDPNTKIKVLENVPQGALMVVLIDGNSGFAIWAGAATAEIKNLSPEISKQRLGYTISEMFSKLP
jgi:hypothetical protein